MQKSIIRKQAEEKLQKLKDLLLKTDVGNVSHAEILEIQLRLQEAEKIVAVYEYLLAQSEIASDIAVHLKIMEKVGKDDEEKLQEKKKTEEQVPGKQEISPEKEIKTVPEPVLNQQNVIEPASPSLNPKTRKLELSINDKYRMINELFHQNQQEFNIAVEQLNGLESIADARQYLNSLVSLYGWDAEKDIVKTLFRLTQKRFA